MKRLLVAVLALSTVSAFAGKSMVKLDGCFDGQCDNLNFGMDSNDAAGNSAAETKTTDYALNYAYAVNANFGAGLTYASHNKETDGKVGSVGDKYNMIGLNFYYNVDGAWSDSCFFALHYNMKTVDDKDSVTDSGNKKTDIVLEYGHRYSLGKLAGINWNWSPSVTYTMGTQAPNGTGDDTKTTALAINAANFAVVF